MIHQYWNINANIILQHNVSANLQVRNLEYESQCYG